MSACPRIDQGSQDRLLLFIKKIQSGGSGSAEQETIENFFLSFLHSFPFSVSFSLFLSFFLKSSVFSFICNLQCDASAIRFNSFKVLFSNLLCSKILLHFFIMCLFCFFRHILTFFSSFEAFLPALLNVAFQATSLSLCLFLSLSLFFFILSINLSDYIFLSRTYYIPSFSLSVILSLYSSTFIGLLHSFRQPSFHRCVLLVLFATFIFSPFSSSLSIAAAAVVTFYSAALRGDKTQFIAACHSDSIVCSFCSEAAKKITSPAAAENTKRNLF